MTNLVEFYFLRETVDLPVRHCKQNNIGCVIMKIFLRLVRKLRKQQTFAQFVETKKWSAKSNFHGKTKIGRNYTIELEFLQNDRYHALTIMWRSWNLQCHWSPFTPGERNVFKFCDQMPQKPKGFFLEPKFNNFSAILCPQKTEAVHLDATSEVKMEARSEIYTKFHVKYCFALSQDAVWRNFETP